MGNIGSKLSAEKLAEIKRRAFSVSKERLIKAYCRQPTDPLPLIIEPNVRGLNLPVWAASNRDFIEERLLKHGGILFRNFNVNGADEFASFVKTLYQDLLSYNERSSPRTEVSENIYTSTDYPANQEIFLHNENSYQQGWPMRIFFYCLIPPEEGGETPIADCRRVFQRIDPAIREKFMRKNWMYARNFNTGFGLPWQTVFQSAEMSVVEEHCRRNNIQVEWRAGNHLRTRAVRPVATSHPQTGEMTWFNHATFFHISTLEPTVRDAMLELFDEQDVPTNTYYGDGSPIEPPVLDHLREAYRQETILFSWKRDDILLLDNMLVAHGRSPYVGQRKILVGLAQSINRNDIADQETHS